ncbi:DLA class II histocompatibility antigen, DR-1 beta chain [Myotis davidii]|uniref:DLA class II histocompatibility antigen, DR-1 beta chain n=1 Tax=Myotis davidii TaxID=225400 RepID=L5M013_MYODS|nr:DLA class II histocompatibility antigen, DR-1 beta chain [Myotis davidii]
MGEFRAETELRRPIAEFFNSLEVLLQRERAQVDRFCRDNYRFSEGFLVQRQTHFLYQPKSECHFSNGTEQVRFLERHIYNGQEFMCFDTDMGEFRAETELRRPIAEFFNSLEVLLQRERAQVDRFCRDNYRFSEGFLVQRQTEPTVTVYPAKTQRLQHHNLLVCCVSDFYPGHIEVHWLRNGQEEEAVVVTMGLIQNGDWTFQTLVMLETVPRSGELYTCQVRHPSSTSPVTVEWSETPSDLTHFPLRGLCLSLRVRVPSSHTPFSCARVFPSAQATGEPCDRFCEHP